MISFFLSLSALQGFLLELIYWILNFTVFLKLILRNLGNPYYPFDTKG